LQRIGAEGTQRVDVRLVAATNRRLEDSVAAGEFREDLFFRLNVFPPASRRSGAAETCRRW
jgi:Nif-specific regulatory protein